MNEQKSGAGAGTMDLASIEKIFKGRQPGAESEFHFFGILVPLVEKAGKLHFLYEVRGSRLDRQPGEICFPGGALEPGETLQECAVRETCEELGIREEEIRVVSPLDTVYTTNNFAMFCFLGVIPEETLEHLHLSREEVAETYLVPLEWFAEHPPTVYVNHYEAVIDEDFPTSQVVGAEKYKWRGGRAEVPVYEPYEGHVLWGLTARITKRFIDIVMESTGAGPGTDGATGGRRESNV